MEKNSDYNFLNGPERVEHTVKHTRQVMVWQYNYLSMLGKGLNTFVHK